MPVTTFLRPRVLSLFLFLPLLGANADPVRAAEALSPPLSTLRSLIVGIDAGTRVQAAARQWAREAGLRQARTRLAEAEKTGLGYSLAAPPEGPVRTLRQRRAGGGPGQTPRLWIEAEVAFTLKDRRTDGPPDAAALDRAGLLDVRIGSDRREYRDGEKLTLWLQGNRDFYARIVQVDPRGRVVQLLPNNYRQISVFGKDKRYRLPDEGDRYSLSIGPPYGTWRFVIYATRLPMSHVNLKTVGGGVYEYRSSLKAFAKSVRQVVPAGEQGLAEFCESAWEVRALKR